VGIGTVKHLTNTYERSLRAVVLRPFRPAQDLSVPGVEAEEAEERTIQFAIGDIRFASDRIKAKF